MGGRSCNMRIRSLENTVAFDTIVLQMLDWDVQWWPWGATLEAVEPLRVTCSCVRQVSRARNKLKIRDEVVRAQCMTSTGGTTASVSL